MSISNDTRAVAFTQYSELAFIPRDDAQYKWHSTQDKLLFRQSLIQDINRVSRDFQDAAARATVTPELLQECVGIEPFVTNGLAKHIDEKKRAHIQAVLQEQSLQREQGVCNPERLAMVSMVGSQSTAKRAQAFATGYSKI